MSAPLTLLVGAEVFAPEPLGYRDVLLAGERIVWIGTAPPAGLSALGAEVVDLSGKRLVPGFVDGHAHLTGGGGEAGFASRVPAPDLPAYTRAGVTSVVGLLGTDDVVRTTGELLATARALRELGLSTWIWTGGYHVPPATLLGSIERDIVHLDLCIGAGELAISDHRSSQPTLEEVLRLASQCHVAGLMTGKAGVLHLHLGDGSRGLELVREALDRSELPARVFHPTHVNRKRTLFEESLAYAERGGVIDVTAFPTDVEPGEDELSAFEAVRTYLASNLPPERLTVSSDGGGCLPHFDDQGRVCRFDVGTSATLPALLRALVEGGTPLEQALLPITRNPATYLRLPRKGQLAVGADGDLVALDGQLAVTDVFAGGQAFVRDSEPIRRGLF